VVGQLVAQEAVGPGQLVGALGVVDGEGLEGPLEPRRTAAWITWFMVIGMPGR
jgi:hypothetical protein